LAPIQVTFKLEGYDITITGDSVKEIVEKYREVSRELNSALGSKTRPRAQRSSPAPGRRSAFAGGSVNSKIIDLVESGFFDDARSLQELKDELAKKGVIKPITTLAARAKEVVEAGYLERDHGTVDDRKLWVYSKSKKPPIQ